MSTKDRFDRILVAVDGSESALKACEAVTPLVIGFNSSVTILYVVPPPSIYSAPLIEESRARVDREAEKHLETAAAVIGGVDRSTLHREVLHANTSVVQSIVRYAAEKRSDLIVLGTRGIGGFRKMLLGSVSNGVAEHASRPVLIVRTRFSGDRPRFRKVVVGVDGSSAASRAARLASALARGVGTEELTILHIVHVEPYVYASGSAPAIDNVVRQAREAGEKLVSAAAEALAESAQGMTIRQELVQDAFSPAKGITEYAKENDTDLIVVGTRGLGGFKKLLLGSVASEVLGYASCSVLVVR